jgi:hypothetical protein
MTNRSKIVLLLTKCCPVSFKTINVIADKLIDQGATIPVRCKECQNGTDDAWPDGQVWCKKMGRYMKKDGFCSEGVK